MRFLKRLFMKKTKCDMMNVFDYIDLLRAYGVTDTEFEKVWGCSVEEHLGEAMDFVEELEVKSYE